MSETDFYGRLKIVHKHSGCEKWIFIGKTCHIFHGHMNSVVDTKMWGPGCRCLWQDLMPSYGGCRRSTLQAVSSLGGLTWITRSPLTYSPSPRECRIWGEGEFIATLTQYMTTLMYNTHTREGLASGCLRVYQMCIIVQLFSLLTQDSSSSLPVLFYNLL